MNNKIIFIIFFSLGVISYFFIPKDYNATQMQQNSPVASPSAITHVQLDGNGQCVTYEYNDGRYEVRCQK
jgi:hypothetical protein